MCPGRSPARRSSASPPARSSSSRRRPAEPAPGTRRALMRDVRMRGFAARADVEEVERFLAETARPLGAEPVALLACAGRVLAADVRAGVDVPSFARSAMDGWAVRGEDTFGASAYDPIRLRVLGESLPGRPFPGRVAPGAGGCMMSGGALPVGGGGVVMGGVGS